MALPSVSMPEFRTVIPSTGETITYRPFLVKEEKILLMALSGGDSNEMALAIRKILKSCILDEINIDSLATFDIEYLFLQLRGKSVGEVIEVRAKHYQNTDCPGTAELSIPIDQIQLTNMDLESQKIMLNDTIGIKVRYPTMDDLTGLKLDDADSIMSMIVNCVEYAFDETEVYSEFTHDEMKDFLENFKSEEYAKVIEFFDKLPQLRYEAEWECPVCKEKEKIVLEGLTSFFT